MGGKISQSQSNKNRPGCSGTANCGPGHLTEGHFFGLAHEHKSKSKIHLCALLIQLLRNLEGFCFQSIMVIGKHY